MIFGSSIVAVDPHWLSQAEAALAAGTKLAAVRRADPARATPRRGMSVVPIMGLLTRRETYFTSFFGGQTFTSIRRDFRAAMDDRTTDTVLLYVDSPGGDAVGAMELSDEIRAARSKKRIVTLIEGLGASAAFWISSGAAEIYASPSSEIGSIGVMVAHVERSEAERKAGLKTTLIFSGRNKVLGNPFEPLSERARAVLQADVDRVNDDFINCVAKNRNVPLSTVRTTYGEGLLYVADRAFKAGMIDGVLTLDQVMSSRGRPSRDAINAAAIRAGLSQADIAIREIELRERSHHAEQVRKRSIAAIAAVDDRERRR